MTMRWRESLTVTVVFWLTMAGLWVLAVVSGSETFAGVLVVLLIPAGLVAGLFRPRLPSLPLLLCATVIAIGAVAATLLANAEDPDSDVGDFGNALALFVGGSAFLTCVAALVGAFFAGPVRSATGEVRR
jgi:hypothetical protein